MSARYLSAAVLFALICNAADVQAATSFCNAIKKLPLQDLQKTSAAINKIETTRSSFGSSGDGRSIEDVERIVRPYELSSELKQTFGDLAGDPGSDYDVYRRSDSLLFDFRMVDGSEKCSSDIWAAPKGNRLEEVRDGPDLGDACDVARIQHAYEKRQGQEDIQEIRVVEMKVEEFDDVCVVTPEN